MTAKKVWLVRAGRHGEDEAACLNTGRSIIGFVDVPDLSRFASLDELIARLQSAEPSAPEGRAETRARQLWAFRAQIQVDDIVVLPLKTNRGHLAFGTVSGNYEFVEIEGQNRHVRAVRWTHPEVPRSRFKQDLLYSFGAFMTVCRITRNNAELRIPAVLGGREDQGISQSVDLRNAAAPADSETRGSDTDLEQAASDEVVAFIRRKFPGHDMARLVEAILQAEDFKTRRSPPGIDGGADVLAGRGPLGLDPPSLCVQVKATEEPADVRILRELAGTMDAFKATQGLLVCWGGFKSSVQREARQQSSFKIALWGQSELLEAIYRNYDKLPAELQAELPLKRVWMLVREEEDQA
jgi:restriction system protein